MSVMQRKLFANKEARAKLRDMGGIMSSFPELSGEVQRFNNGMMVEAPLPPTGPTLMDQLVAASLLERTSSEPPLRRGQGETPAPAPVVTERPVSEGLNRKELRDLRATQPPVEVFKDDTEELAREDAEAVARERAAAGITSAEDSFGARLARGDKEGAEEVLTRVRDAVDRDRAGRIADLLPTPEEMPEVTTDETGNGDTPDLRARAEERIKLFQDLFGSDEPTARDRAMQFAMIGLAIAAGQSPNALTNIASGLLAGTQAMTAQEAERRKGARELRASALESVLQEQQLDRRLGAEVIQRDRRTAAELAKMRTDAYQEALTAADDGKALDHDPNTETPQQYAARKADALVKFYLQSLGAGAPTGANEYWNPETGEVVYWDGNAWVPKNG